jgi:predicted nucleic acid-binding protein
MKIYFDTSLLLKAYIKEAGTAEALEIIRAGKPPIPLSHLLELELRTAIRLKHGRREIEAAAMRGVLQVLENDFANGVLARPAYDLTEVFRRAESLSSKHAAATLARTADIWHVAAALECGCKGFATFDQRQRNVASLAGLTVHP